MSKNIAILIESDLGCLYTLDTVENKIDIDILAAASVGPDGNDVLLFKALDDKASKYIKTKDEIKYIKSLPTIKGVNLKEYFDV